MVSYLLRAGLICRPSFPPVAKLCIGARQPTRKDPPDLAAGRLGRMANTGAEGCSALLRPWSLLEVYTTFRALGAHSQKALYAFPGQRISGAAYLVAMIGKPFVYHARAEVGT